MGRRNQMLGLKTPEQSIVRIIDESAPKRVETSTDRLEAALEQLVASESPAACADRLRRELRALEHQPNGYAAAPVIEPVTIDAERCPDHD